LSNHFEARFSAVGGQGIILAGGVLADAAANFEGKYAVQSPTYTAQVRGGPTKIDVIIDTEEIIYPRTTAIDFFMALAQNSYNSFAKNLKPGCTVLVDPNLVTKVDETKYKVHRIPIIEITKKELGRMVFTSLVSLGAMVELTKCVKQESVFSAIRRNVPKGTEEINIRAFNVGKKAVENFVYGKCEI